MVGFVTSQGAQSTLRRLYRKYALSFASTRTKSAKVCEADFKLVKQCFGFTAPGCRYAALTMHPLAQVGLARAHALSGDSTGGRKAYEEFFTLWKDADPDIPILKQAKAEYAKLR